MHARLAESRSTADWFESLAATTGSKKLTNPHVYGTIPYMNPTSTTSDARLDLRMSAADKERIVRAASLRGVPIAAFVREAALRESESVMNAAESLTLSAEESRRFLQALDTPFEPNAKLKKALARIAGAA